MAIRRRFLFQRYAGAGERCHLCRDFMEDGERCAMDVDYPPYSSLGRHLSVCHACIRAAAKAWRHYVKNGTER